jgi:predicted  nucleic acid-binding Zn-ribbon protein
MTNFERIFIMTRPSKISVSYSDESKKNQSGVIDLTAAFNKGREEMLLQQEYRELDRQSRELEKEIQAVRALRMELEKYKVDFSLSIEDEATKKIQEVVNGINQMFK